eukprot:gnl/TRDRNA2_/TRDRNA2_176103_c0_seq7.p1 gnl/TRDRNA2_/TRDRNA2_176103_c0~~gnl/TRDRNA2_/TRDRNA2_176103_c0_seq7.p1  ORF type:complete len:295 (+),score=7.39 gnl/TRDRNA2_/TRDRNA2_176103_c0_seq7:62-946(+)
MTWHIAATVYVLLTLALQLAIALPLTDGPAEPSVAFFVLGYNDSEAPLWALDTDDVFTFAPPQNCQTCPTNVTIPRDAWISKPLSWWCAQRHYMSGLATFFSRFPQSDYYFLVDADTVVFRKRLQSMLSFLTLNGTKPRDDIFMGHSFLEPSIQLRMVQSGGGVLLSGNALRRLVNTGQLNECANQSLHGAYCWYHLDWTLGASLSTIGVLPHGHQAFQQFKDFGGCDETAVACHPVKDIVDQRDLIVAREHFDHEFDYDSAQPCPDQNYEWTNGWKSICHRDLPSISNMSNPL